MRSSRCGLEFELHRHPQLGGAAEDDLEVELGRLAAVDQPRRGVAEDVDLRVLQGAQHALGLLRGRQVEAGVEGDEDEVEPGEHLVLEVERAVAQDVHLHRAQDADLGVAGAHLVDLLPLLAQAVGVEPAGHRQRLAVVGDHHVLVAAGGAGLDHLLDGVAAVRPGRVHVEVAAQVLDPDQVGEPAGRRGLDLAAVLAQLGGIQARPTVA